MNIILKDVLNRYLDSKNIPYAILLNGDWGSGKTWYLKNKFEDDFPQKIIYTSVNGIKSLDDITQQILYRKMYLSEKIIDDPKAKLVWGITKQFGNALLKKYTGYNIEDAKALGVEIKEFSTIKDDEVLIIDDLERMPNNITLEEFFGFVSTNFTEENYFKVILVANEKELISKLGEDCEKYNKIKEKTIWQTLEYKVDFNECYNDLIINLSDKAKAILVKHKDYLLSKFDEYKVTNLRWVLYFFQAIDDLAESKATPFSYDIDQLILNVALVICIEYKSGNLAKETDYIKTSRSPLSLLAKENSGNYENNLNKEEIFAKKYLSKNDNDYHYFKSIYELICNGYLDNNLLTEELVHYKEKVEVDWEKHLETIEYFFKVEESEFMEAWNKVLEYAKEGKYDIGQIELIIDLYEHYTHFGINFPFTKDKLYQLLNDAFKQNTFETYAYFNFRHLQPNFSYKRSLEFDNLIQLIQKKKEEIDKLKNNNNINMLLEKVFTGDFHRFSMIDFITESKEIHLDKMAEYATQSTNNFLKVRACFIDSELQYFDRAESDENFKNKLFSIISKIKEKAKPLNTLKLKINESFTRFENEYNRLKEDKIKFEEKSHQTSDKVNQIPKIPKE